MALGHYEGVSDNIVIMEYFGKENGSMCPYMYGGGGGRVLQFQL